MQNTYASIYSALAKPVCDRCMRIIQVGTSACTQKNCHRLFAQQANDVLELFKKENVVCIKLCLNEFQSFLKDKKTDTRLPQVTRQYIESLERKYSKHAEGMIKEYEERWETIYGEGETKT